MARVLPVIEFDVSREGRQFMVVVPRETIEHAMERPAEDGQLREWVRANLDMLNEVADLIRPRPTRTGARVTIRIQDLPN